MDRKSLSKPNYFFYSATNLPCSHILKFNITGLPNPNISILCIRYTYCDWFAPIGSVHYVGHLQILETERSSSCNSGRLYQIVAHGRINELHGIHIWLHDQYVPPENLCWMLTFNRMSERKQVAALMNAVMCEKVSWFVSSSVHRERSAAFLYYRTTYPESHAMYLELTNTKCENEYPEYKRGMAGNP